MPNIPGSDGDGRGFVSRGGGRGRRPSRVEGGVSARSVLRGDSRVEALYQPALLDVLWDLSVKRE